LHIVLPNPTWIDPATFDPGILVLLLAIAVVDLDFIAAHQVNTGVGIVRDAEFQMDFHISEFRFRHEIDGPPISAVDKHTRPYRDQKLLWVCWIQSDPLR